jgi:xanthosine utilization system XapX-like protein
MLTAVRIGLPAAIAVVGIVLVIVGSETAQGAGIVLIGVAALVVLANLFMRLALQSEDDRRREAERRER